MCQCFACRVCYEIVVMERDYFAKLQKWAESGEYTDLVLSCAEHNFRVHQVIVCAHSQFFQVACSGGFKVR